MFFQHPQVEEKIVDELRHVLGDKEHADFNDLGNLQYLQCVINESLRMCPPAASGPVRMLDKDYTLQGVKLKKGTNVFLGIYTVHMDENNWHQPKEFRPERFSEENKNKIVPGSFFPFISGIHSCIGQNFAQLELKSILSHLYRRFHFTLVPGHDVTAIENITLKPKNGMMMYVSSREW